MKPPEGLLERVESLLGSAPVEWQRGTGGYSIAERWSLTLSDGRRVFAKMAPTDDLAWRIRDEHRHMSLFEEDFRCEIIAWENGDRPLLVLEDLRDAHWPPPWRPGDVERVRQTLERIWAMPSSRLPVAAGVRDMFESWEKVVVDPSGFLSLGIASQEWLDACLPTLIEAARSVSYEGTEFCHMDVRSDNMCFAGARVVFVDWNWAVQGNRNIDLACWLPSLRLEGGPLPEEVAPGLGGYASGASGYFAWSAPQPISQGAPTVRRFQLRQLRMSLPWACRELGLPQPDLQWARPEIRAVAADFEAGRITEAEWHERIEEPLIDAYLSRDDPRGQSGKGGDETDWRWSRELVLDVFPEGPSTFLDVGCANGYLMESIHRWGRERGLQVEPYGLDISWRIASLAKQRLPHWADRIFVGNAIDWTPPRRFDVVQIGIDEVPHRRRRELVDRVLREFVVPSGVVVCRPNRVGSGWEDPHVQLEALGFRPDGVIEAVHPVSGQLRRTAWLRAPGGSGGSPDRQVP